MRRVLVCGLLLASSIAYADVTVDETCKISSEEVVYPSGVKWVWVRAEGPCDNPNERRLYFSQAIVISWSSDGGDGVRVEGGFPEHLSLADLRAIYYAAEKATAAVADEQVRRATKRNHHER